MVDRVLDPSLLWMEHLGAFYDTDAVRSLLGREGEPVSRQAVHKRKGPPPASLAGFPPRRTSASLRTLYRIFWHRDALTGVENSPWRFSTLPGGDGRFDVPAPNGTRYWSSRRYGAWVEVFRGVRVVDVSDARARRVWTGNAPVLRLANLLAPKAYSYGVTAAISNQPDYSLPQQWAASRP